MADEKEMSFSPTGAARDNKGKVPFSWVPYIALEAIASVLWRSSKDGGGKYERHNWRKGAQHSVPLDSALRHAFRRADGEMTDKESGLPHSWHLLVNAVFLVFYEKYFPQLNDIPVPPEEAKPLPQEDSPPAKRGPNPMLGLFLQALAAGQQTPAPADTKGDSESKDWRPGDDEGNGTD